MWVVLVWTDCVINGKEDIVVFGPYEHFSAANAKAEQYEYLRTDVRTLNSAID